ncbi:thiamine diphosphokinase [Actinobacillus porcinus]|uniref:Thiamine diphosphokinase n=1 Tax=Actinobacillus porcinus TaxID=51048 RepID=A0ABY6TNQ5_9PAST|nr:thiamine diphosphokinase [Actinobacillus porcinus]VFY93725.1 Thiamine pyrophosphokinase [Actinobacillus porcinus]VTU09034.1 Thiamine pyrophosphokinase [Actinobacillus porcinus]
MNIALVAGGDFSPIEQGYDYYVGIDRGCLALLDNGLPLDFAVGDFDSVTESELMKIRANAKEIVSAPTVKNDTDTELALKVVFARFPRALVTVYGAFGGRLDHLFSNVFLPSEPALAPFMQQISLVNTQNHISYAPVGKHQIFPVQGMNYVSFMSDDKLTITGAKYELNAQNFFSKKIYSSNEFIGKPIEVSLNSGYVVIIQSRDRE